MYLAAVWYLAPHNFGTKAHLNKTKAVLVQRTKKISKILVITSAFTLAKLNFLTFFYMVFIASNFMSVTKNLPKQKIIKMIVIPFVDLQKISLFPKFGGCSSKIEPATLISILNFSRAWQSYLVSYAF